MKVTLWAIQPDMELDKKHLIAEAARVCHASVGDDDDELLSKLVEWVHLSPFEHGVWCKHMSGFGESLYRSMWHSGYKYGADITMDGYAPPVMSINGRVSMEIGKELPKEDGSFLTFDDLSDTEMMIHGAVTFYIEGISRACSHQLVRHRAASFSERSMRYCDTSESGAVCPQGLDSQQQILFDGATSDAFTVYSELLLLGINKEDARAVLPISTKTNIVVTMKVQYFKHFLEMRTTKHAQEEIRNLAFEMARLAREANSFFDWGFANGQA